MPKPWAKLEQNYINHPKFLALSANAICLWHEGKNYCDMHSTDGLIPRDALKTFRFAGKKAVDQLTQPLVKPWKPSEQFAPLWELHVVGFKMHDYLDHNDCRDVVVARIDRSDVIRSKDARRQSLYRDKALQAQIRTRDGGLCRYCGREVNWLDRRSPLGATFDHVDPSGENTVENIVTACRGCNSVKGARLPAEAEMVLLSISDLFRNRKIPISSVENPPPTETATATETLSLVKEPLKREKTAVVSLSPAALSDPFTDPTITERAGRFIERYQALYPTHRKGAQYAVRPMRDYAAAVTLCQTWTDDGRLDKLAAIFLTTDHRFAEEGSRTIPQFLALASWCDGKLAEWESRKAAV